MYGRKKGASKAAAQEAAQDGKKPPQTNIVCGIYLMAYDRSTVHSDKIRRIPVQGWVEAVAADMGVKDPSYVTTAVPELYSRRWFVRDPDNRHIQLLASREEVLARMNQPLRSDAPHELMGEAACLAFLRKHAVDESGDILTRDALGLLTQEGLSEEQALRMVRVLDAHRKIVPQRSASDPYATIRFSQDTPKASAPVAEATISREPSPAPPPPPPRRSDDAPRVPVAVATVRFAEAARAPAPSHVTTAGGSGDNADAESRVTHVEDKPPAAASATVMATTGIPFKRWVLFLEPGPHRVFSETMRQVHASNGDGRFQNTDPWDPNHSPLITLGEGYQDEGAREVVRRFLEAPVPVLLEEDDGRFRLALHPAGLHGVPVSERPSFRPGDMEFVRRLQQEFSPPLDRSGHKAFKEWYATERPGHNPDSAYVRLCGYRPQALLSNGLGILTTWRDAPGDEGARCSYWTALPGFERFDPLATAPAPTRRGRSLAPAPEPPPPVIAVVVTPAPDAVPAAPVATPPVVEMPPAGPAASYRDDTCLTESDERALQARIEELMGLRAHIAESRAPLEAALQQLNWEDDLLRKRLEEAQALLNDGANLRARLKQLLG